MMRHRIALPLIAASIGLAACSGGAPAETESAEVGNEVSVTNDVTAVDEGAPLDNGVGAEGNASDAGALDLNATDTGGNAGDASTNAL